MLEWLRVDPLSCLQFMLYRAPAVLLALTLHEIAHGYIAWKCGDPTAHDCGRLSLNPAHHLSLVGTLLMFTAGMGWAKPVPVNPNNFRSRVRDDLLVSLAGVVMNFCLFSLALLLSIGVNELLWNPELFSTDYALFTRTDFLSIQGHNFSQILYSDSDLIPFLINGNRYYPVELTQFLRQPALIHVQRFLYQFEICNIGLCVFNLLPFPPLDGFHVFNDILLGGRLKLNARTFSMCMVALFVVMNVTNIFSTFMSSVIHFVQGGMLSLFLSCFGLA